MMGLIVSEVYDALIEAGASPDRAKAAAGAVPPAESMVTREEMTRLETNMATKEGVARLEDRTAKVEDRLAKVEANMARLEADMATKEDVARLEGRLAKVEVNMATKEDLARLEIVTNENFSRVDKQIAVLRFAVFSFGPAILALLVKLTFFP